MSKEKIYRTTEQKQKLVKKVEALVAKGINTQAACRSHGIWAVQYNNWRKGRGLGPAGQRKPKNGDRAPRTLPTRSRRRPPGPITIEIPDTAPICLLYGQPEQILEALRLLRG